VNRPAPGWRGVLLVALLAVLVLRWLLPGWPALLVLLLARGWTGLVLRLLVTAV
jgi:hypothetical protein